MKNLVFSLVVFLTSTLAFSQELKVSKVNYKAVVLNTYMYEKRISNEASKTIFEFNDKVIRTTNKDQTKVFYLQEEFVDEVIKGPGFEYPVKMAAAKDHGGFDCSITVGWHPKTKTYFIVVGYANVDFMYKCKESSVGIPKGYVPLPGHKMFRGEYTEEEVREFMKFWAKWQMVNF